MLSTMERVCDRLLAAIVPTHRAAADECDYQYRCWKTTPSPGSGLRHQQTGGPAACGQYSISIATPSNSRNRANIASASAAVIVFSAICFAISSD